MNGLRATTLVAGGVLAVGGLAVTGVFSAWGVSYADPERMTTSIPADATAIEVDIDDGLAYRTGVEVYGVTRDGAMFTAPSAALDMTGSVAASDGGGIAAADEPLSGTASGFTGEAHLSGATSILGGAVPTLRLEMRSTTAVITIANPRVTNYSLPWGSAPYAVVLRLPADRHYDAITVRSSGQVDLSGVQAGAIDATASAGGVDVVGLASTPDRITAAGVWGTRILVPDDGTAWSIATPAWATPAWIAKYGCTVASPASPCEVVTDEGEQVTVPIVQIPDVPGSRHAIDVSGAPQGSLTQVGYYSR